MEIRYLDILDFVALAADVLDTSEESVTWVADLGLADAALAAPRAGFGEFELYPDFAAKVAVVGYRIAKYHPLPDGNKRTAFLAMLRMVNLNGWEWVGWEDAMVDAMWAVARGDMPEDEFIRWVDSQIEPGPEAETT